MEKSNKSDKNKGRKTGFQIAHIYGTSGKALHSASILNNTWLIDSGAINYITSDFQQVIILNTTHHIKRLFPQPMALQFLLWEK